MTNRPHIVFAGGGSAGHLNPGLAVAAHLVKELPHAEITFAGSGKPLERHVVRGAGFKYSMIPCRPVPESPLDAIRFVTDNVAGYWASRWLLKEQQVSLVVGLGGYACTTMLQAAAARGIPTVLLEQNAVPGRATRWLASSVQAVCIGFEQVKSQLDSTSNVIFTGTPARTAFEREFQRETARGYTYEEEQARSENPRERRLVILGGAGGARSLNKEMPAVLRRLGNRLDRWRIIHQTGEGQLQEVEQRYTNEGINALAVSYIDEIASVLFETDLVVCRASGSLLAELSLATTPAVLVPYPQASDDHQMVNAKIYADANACTLIDEGLLGDDLGRGLERELDLLMTNEDRRCEMARNIRQMAQPHASSQIATLICDTLSERSRRTTAA